MSGRSGYISEQERGLHNFNLNMIKRCFPAEFGTGTELSALANMFNLHITVYSTDIRGNLTEANIKPDEIEISRGRPTRFHLALQGEHYQPLYRIDNAGHRIR